MQILEHYRNNVRQKFYRKGGFYLKNIEEIKNILVMKVENELFKYKENLIRNCTKEQIYSHSYETMTKEEISCSMSEKDFEISELKALLKCDNVLDSLYGAWMHTDVNYHELLDEVIDEEIDKIASEYEKSKRDKER